MHRLLRIADVVVSIESQGLPWDFGSGNTYGSFQVDNEPPDMRLVVHWCRDDKELPVVSTDEVSWTCRNWVGCVQRDAGGTWTFEVPGPSDRFSKRRVGIFNPDMSRGDIYVGLGSGNKAVQTNPFGPPLDRLVFVHLMARRRGILLHASGLVQNGLGLVFAGASGTGKSTIARLASQANGATVLGEDSLILRKHGTRFRVYGTPWNSDPRLVDARGVPLDSVFFIEHGQENSAVPVPWEKAVERLLRRSFLMTYDPQLALDGLDVFLDLAEGTKFYDLSFVPTMEVIEFLNGHR